MKRWIKVEIDVDDKDSTVCIDCKQRPFGGECMYNDRCPACLAADVTDLVAENEALEKENKCLRENCFSKGDIDYMFKKVMDNLWDEKMDDALKQAEQEASDG